MKMGRKEMMALSACPKCKHPLTASDDTYRCTYDRCQSIFPVVNGRPILINEENSLFRIKNFLAPNAKGEKVKAGTRIRNRILSLVPAITHNWVAKRNYLRLVGMLKDANQSMSVLIVGAGDMGEGINCLVSEETIKVVETDIAPSHRIAVIADAHDLPFLSGSFDAVVAQAMLEHVVDPYRCVDEMYRVLKPNGLIYAETPFMFPVHLGAYDFTRFSLLGHRRLFRYFSEIDANMASGPANALALSIRSFVLSFSNSRWLTGFAKALLPFFIFWLKYFDFFLLKNPHASDFASTYYFLGKKAVEPVPDKCILESHWSMKNTKTDW